MDAATACLEALGVDRGLLHTEVILDDAGAAHVVETHLRGGGDMILDLVRSSTGLDLTELYVRDVLEGLDDIPAATNLGFASSQFVFPVEARRHFGMGRCRGGAIDAWCGCRDHPPERGRAECRRRSIPATEGPCARSPMRTTRVEACERARAAALTPTPVLESA